MSEEIPKKGLGGVVVNEGKDFYLEVQEVDVPECSEFSGFDTLKVSDRLQRMMICWFDSTLPACVHPMYISC